MLSLFFYHRTFTFRSSTSRYTTCFSGHRTKSRFEQLFFNLPPPYLLSDNLLTFWLTAAASAVRRSTTPKIQSSGLPVVHQRTSNIRHLAAVPDPSSPPCFHLSGPALHFCLLLTTLPSFLSRYLSDRKLLLPFPFPTSAFPAIVRHFLPSIFRTGFQRKLPVLFYVQHFSPLSVSLFSHLPPFPGSTIFSARRLCCLSPVITYFYSSPAPRSGLPSRFSPASDETAPLSALLPIRFPAAPAHDPKVLLSSHPARQMVLPGLKIKISYPYQCYHKDGKGYQILFVVKVVTF